MRGGEEARACATATARTDGGAARGATHKGRGARGSPQPDLRSWPRRRHLLLRRLLAAWRLAATRAAPPFALPSDVTPSPKRDVHAQNSGTFTKCAICRIFTGTVSGSRRNRSWSLKKRAVGPVRDNLLQLVAKLSVPHSAGRSQVRAARLRGCALRCCRRRTPARRWPPVAVCVTRACARAYLCPAPSAACEPAGGGGGAHAVVRVRDDVTCKRAG